MTASPVYPTLHVLAQSLPHRPAVLIGNRAGLTALHNAILRAMSGGVSKAAVFAEDGEGYGLVVVCREDIDGAPFGYTDEKFQNRHPWPEWLIEAMRRVGE